jgi:hydroxyacylglutathione hydrolase
LIVQQIKLAKMATFCYLVGDEETKTCALIDPAFDTDRILNTAEKEGFRVTHLINTHGHSDHTAGNGAIVGSTGALLLIHGLDAGMLGKMMNRAFTRMLGGGKSPQPDQLLKNGDLIKIGKTEFRVIHTPGHTRGSICLYAPGHIFTGDTLFVGGVGRSDLPGGSMRQLLGSIHEKVYTLPGKTRVWPGHDYGLQPHSTISQEKQTNPFTRVPADS